MKLYKKLSPTISIILIGVATYLLMFILLGAAISPQRYDLRVGMVSPITITASKDVEDTLSTDRLRDEAARQVQPSYLSDSTVQPAVLAALQEAFTRVLQFKSRVGVVPDDMEITDEEYVQAANAISPMTANKVSLEALLRVDADSLSSLYEQTFAMVRETLSGKLSQGQEGEAVSKIRRDLLAAGYEENLTGLAVVLVESTIQPNMLLDRETTEANRQKARDEVETITYKQGQNIVRSGEVITANQIEMLNDLGMLMDKKVDFTLYLGVGILLFLLAMALILYLFAFKKHLNPRMTALMCVIIVMTTAISLLVRTLNSYLMPVALGAMLTTLLIGPGLAFVVNALLAVVTALLGSVDSATFTSTMFSLMLISIVSGTMCISIIRRRPKRATVLLAGVAVAAVNALTTFAVGLVNSTSQVSVFAWALWAGGSGLMSSVLAIGFQLVLEALFNLVTPDKLMELSNPNQPLLRRLLLEAPGTYHHAILVANLAEAAANAVNADGLLARVGAYYHDIGKLKRPLYFKENQLSDNPHDRTDPRVSTAILTAHPRDGVEMAQRAKLPEAVQDIILQHHGDTPVLYFYDKAVKQGGEVSLDDFRYEGPRPRSKEAAIVMLADTSEAAARAVPESTPEKISQMIRRLVRSKMEDGQLDDCLLTFRDLNCICDAFVTVLIGVYHERVEYPNVVLPERAEYKPVAQAIPAEPGKKHLRAPKATSGGERADEKADAKIAPEARQAPETRQAPDAESTVVDGEGGLPNAD